MKPALLALAFALVFAAPSLAQEPLDLRAQQIAKWIAAEPVIDTAAFDASFLKKIPVGMLKPVFVDLFNKFGPSTAMSLTGKDSNFSGRYEMMLAKEYVVTVSITVQPKAPYQIIGLQFGPPTPALADFDAVKAALAKLPGTTGLCIRALGGKAPEGTILAEKDAGDMFAIGSAFKLYVLGALARDVSAGRRKLEDVVRLESVSQSLSGRMRTWPVGSPVTLHTLAAAMISESDNTATDHLIAALGRESIEAMLEPMKNSFAAKNRPFLTTHEMFKLKFTRDGLLADRYAPLDSKARRTMLDKDVAAQPLSETDIDPMLFLKPSHIDTIEWFASPRDLCRAMEWLRAATTSTPATPLRGVLAINPGIPALKASFAWVGFKGGSESGVMTLTFLLESKGETPRTYVMSAAWNDPSAGVDEEKFVGLLARAAHLIAKTAATSQRTPAP